MNARWLQSQMARRGFLARLGLGAGVVGASVAGVSAAEPQAAADAAWKPARHSQDDWYDKIPGVHRFVFDSSSPEGFGWALQFANNYFTANQDSYGLKDADLAVVIIARHRATEFAYTDSIWAKYGKEITGHSEYMDPKTKEAPVINPYLATGDGYPQSGKMNALIKKGVQFAVCGMSSRGISGRIAQATGGKTDEIFKEITANLIPNSHLVPAGVLAVNRAQEHGYSFIFAI